MPPAARRVKPRAAATKIPSASPERPLGRPRTRALRYRGSGPTRSGDSERPARERPPDPTLHPACPRTTTCGSYLARNPARVAPLRVDVRCAFSPRSTRTSARSRSMCPLRVPPLPPDQPDTIFRVDPFRARSRHRAARPRGVLLGERARRWGAPQRAGAERRRPRGSPVVTAQRPPWPRPGRELWSRERPGEPAPMRAGPRRNTGRSLNSYLCLSRTFAVVWQILAVNHPQFGVALGAGEPDHSGAVKPSKSLTASRATVGARWAYRFGNLLPPVTLTAFGTEKTWGWRPL